MHVRGRTECTLVWARGRVRSSQLAFLVFIESKYECNKNMSEKKTHIYVKYIYFIGICTFIHMHYYGQGKAITVHSFSSAYGSVTYQPTIIFVLYMLIHIRHSWRMVGFRISFFIYFYLVQVELRYSSIILSSFFAAQRLMYRGKSVLC